MLCTFILYNSCFFIALCVGVCLSVSSLLSCYCPECFVLFSVLISVILFICSVNILRRFGFFNVAMYVCVCVCVCVCVFLFETLG
jgi:hypothetical protein